MISREKTVKLCEESQMTLQQWFEIWKKGYLDEVIPQLEELAKQHDDENYYVELGNIVEVLNETE